MTDQQHVPPHIQRLYDTRKITCPNFFILGAGRCGSTTLYSMLIHHPEIHLSQPKEPSHFNSYFQANGGRSSIEYFNLFSDAHVKPHHKIIGEASHSNLSNPEAAPVLHALFPQAKFVLIFRNPTERAQSLYHWSHAAGIETLDTFELALEAEHERYHDPEFITSCRQYFWNYMYTRSCFYDTQWERYLQFYSREQFHPLSLNELTQDPVGTIKSICQFLGISDSYTPVLNHKGNKEYPQMSKSTRARLDAMFESTIHNTNELAGRDLQIGSARYKN